MLDQLDIQQVLFFDIETVPQHYHYSELDDKVRELWDKKTRWVQENRGMDAEEAYNDRAAIYAEFGKIICISAGYLQLQEGGKYGFRVKSFVGDEPEILEGFAEMIEPFARKKFLLCGHNSREFDIPYVSRRMLIHGMRIPDLINLQGKKPWEVPHLDTLDLWKFGDYKHFTSLDLLAHLFGIPSPKEDMSGADGARVYYEEGDIGRIQKYCERDVLTVAQLLLRFMQLPLVEDSEVTSVE